MPIELYLADLNTVADVKLTKLDNGNYFAEGLPILKPGVWNGKPYTAEDMQAAADAFAEIRDTDKWEPPLRGRHAYDGEGQRLTDIKASETLGWHKGLRWDEAAGFLLADFEIVDAQAAADLQAGKLRFASTEVARGGSYTSPNTGKAYDTAIVGTAFVDNPAVKGMPWNIVVNSADFGRAPNGVTAFASWGGKSVSEVQNAVRDAVFPPPASTGAGAQPVFSSGYVREMYEGYCIVSGPVDGKDKTFRVPYSFDDAGALTVGEAWEVKEAWVPLQYDGGVVDPLAMMTTQAAGMKESLLPKACFLLPETRQLPYRDADPESEKDGDGRHMKAGPINCGRIRAAAGALKGARGSKITTSDLSPAAVKKLKAAAKACGMTSTVIDELADGPAGMPGNIAGTPGTKGAKSMGLIDVLKQKFQALGAKPEDLAELDQFETTSEPPTTPPPPPPAAPPAADPAMKQQLEQLSKANEELVGKVETMADEARHTKAGAMVDAWVTGAKLPPALRVPTYALVYTMLAAPAGSIDVLSAVTDAEGKVTQTTRQATALDLLSEIVTGMAPAINTGNPRGNVAPLAAETPDQPVKKLTDEQLEAIAHPGK